VFSQVYKPPMKMMVCMMMQWMMKKKHYKKQLLYQGLNLQHKLLKKNKYPQLLML
jgi:hypothetical protein